MKKILIIISIIAGGLFISPVIFGATYPADMGNIHSVNFDSTCNDQRTGGSASVCGGSFSSTTTISGYSNTQQYSFSPKNTAGYGGAEASISNTFTYSIWVNFGTNDPNAISTSTPQYLFYKESNASIIVRTSGGKIEAYLNGVGWIYSTQSLESGKWYYISATYDGHFLKLYINGILQATSADTAITISDSSDFSIGEYLNNGNSVFQGFIDEFNQWDYVKTALNLNSIYNNYSIAYNQVFLDQNIIPISPKEGAVINNNPSAISGTYSDNSTYWDQGFTQLYLKIDSIIITADSWHYFLNINQGQNLNYFFSIDGLRNSSYKYSVAFYNPSTDTFLNKIDDINFVVNIPDRDILTATSTPRGFSGLYNSTSSNSGQGFVLNDCGTFSWNMLGTTDLNIIPCEFQNIMMGTMNSFYGGINNSVSWLGGLIVKTFPLNIFYNINSDIATARIQASSTPSIVLGASSSTPSSSAVFGGHSYNILSADIISVQSNKMNFNFRELISRIMYIGTGLLILLFSAWTINHLRKGAASNKTA